MGLFSRKRKLDNAAMIGTFPARPPMNTTIHNHGTSWPAIIAVGFGCFLLFLPLFWYSLVFLFGRMGARDPEYDSALLVISIPVLVVTIWATGQFLLALLEQWKGYKLDIEREITRREEIKLLAAQTTIEPGRMNEADFEFARVILAVMMRAYEWLEKNKRDAFPARWRPWSLSSSRETAEQVGVRLTQAQANSISVWLHEHGVITSPDGGQITKKFPNLSSVRMMLDNEFGKPIVVVSPTLRDNRGYRPID